MINARGRHVSAALVVALAFLWQDALAASHYSAVKDFSLKSNPVGPWSYLSTTLLTHKFPKFVNIKRLPAWGNDLPDPNGTSVVRNKTGSPVHYLTIVAPTDHLWIALEVPTTVRFQAPSAGAYKIKGDFLGIDTNETSHTVEIDRNGISVFSGTIASYGQSLPYTLNLTLAAGDTLDFICDAGDIYEYLSTGLAADITGP